MDDENTPGVKRHAVATRAECSEGWKILRNIGLEPKQTTAETFKHPAPIDRYDISSKIGSQGAGAVETLRIPVVLGHTVTHCWSPIVAVPRRSATKPHRDIIVYKKRTNMRNSCSLY